MVDERESNTFITALYSAPHGVDAMSMSIPGIVETSTNLAIISLDENGFKVIASHRSSILSSRDDVAKRFGAIFSLIGADVAFEGAYPSWKPNPHSKLTSFCAKAYKEYTKKEPTVTAIHAGLECGIINSRVPGMDSVSFGPTMWDVHSTKERLSISSSCLARGVHPAPVADHRVEDSNASKPGSHLVGAGFLCGLWLLCHNSCKNIDIVILLYRRDTP